MDNHPWPDGTIGILQLIPSPNESVNGTMAEIKFSFSKGELLTFVEGDKQIMGFNGYVVSPIPRDHDPECIGRVICYNNIKWIEDPDAKTKEQEEKLDHSDSEGKKLAG